MQKAERGTDLQPNLRGMGDYEEASLQKTAADAEQPKVKPSPKVEMEEASLRDGNEEAKEGPSEPSL